MDVENNLHARPGDVLGALVIGFYAWAVTVSFGAVLLDVMYAHWAPDAATAFPKAADFLLLLSAVIVFAALPAIGLAWKTRTARYFLIASLVIVVLEFLAPAFLAPLLQGSGTATAIRIAIGASASILASIGFNRFCGRA
jgi:hypothetical protein